MLKFDDYLFKKRLERYNGISFQLEMKNEKKKKMRNENNHSKIIKGTQRSLDFQRGTHNFCFSDFLSLLKLV